MIKRLPEYVLCLDIKLTWTKYYFAPPKLPIFRSTSFTYEGSLYLYLHKDFVSISSQPYPTSRTTSSATLVARIGLPLGINSGLLDRNVAAARLCIRIPGLHSTVVPLPEVGVANMYYIQYLSSQFPFRNLLQHSSFAVGIFRSQHNHMLRMCTFAHLGGRSLGGTPHW